MSDPGTTYRTREEVQRMRSTQDPIRGLQRYIEEWGLASEQELKVRFVLCSPAFFITSFLYPEIRAFYCYCISG
jgi:hypothetical protein